MLNSRVSRRTVFSPRPGGPPSDKAVRRLRAAIVCIMFGTIILAWIAGARTGAQLDDDAYRLQATFDLLGQGVYQPSRTSGFPAFEILGGAVYQVAGIPGVTVLCGMATLLAAFLLVASMRGETRVRGAMCVLCVVASPLVLTNESQVMETSFLLLATAALIFAISKLEMHGPRAVFVIFAGLGLILVLTRPDAVLLCLSTAGALLISAAQESRARVASCAVFAGALCALAIAWIMTRHFPFAPDALLHESFHARIQKALLRTFALFDGVGAVALAVCLVACTYALVVSLRRDRRQAMPSDDSHEPLHRSAVFLTSWLVGTSVLYLARYVALPNELEYLLPLLIVLSAVIGWMPKELKIARGAGMAALAMVLATSLFTIGLTERTDPWQPRPEKRITVSNGGFAQDLSARKARGIRSSPHYEDAVAAALRQLGLQPDDIASTGLLRDGAVAFPEGTTITPQDTWSQWTQADAVGSWFPGPPPFGRVLVGCDDVLFAVRSGWRSAQPATSFPDTALVSRGVPLRCGVIGRVEQGGVVLYPYGATNGHRVGEVVANP